MPKAFLDCAAKKGAIVRTESHGATYRRICKPPGPNAHWVAGHTERKKGAAVRRK